MDTVGSINAGCKFEWGRLGVVNIFLVSFVELNVPTYNKYMIFIKVIFELSFTNETFPEHTT